MHKETSSVDPLGKLADEFVQRFRKGERPSLAEYISLHPELEKEIREVFPMLVMMEEAGTGVVAASSPKSSDSDSASERPMPALEKVGGYRITREIGRGGMGVVYEAEQLALGRHVALKVLPLQTAADALGLERFRREAKVVAKLHHTNIVPVFEVGEDQGICYYAMQYIHGQSLEQVLNELRDLRDAARQTTLDHIPNDAKHGDHSVSNQVAHSLLGGFSPPPLAKAPPEQEQTGPPSIDDKTTNHHLDQTRGGTVVFLPGQSQNSLLDSSSGHYYRSVSRVGIQVAEALDYAHREGVLHRDIKPSNLLLDTHSRVWITDFGLAKTTDASITQDGDIIGTLRYMAPERFRGQTDERSDLYSLGLTLYEMLLLRPAFDAPDRFALMHQVSRTQPSKLRSQDPQIPRDLETIIHKAIAKEPARRYASCGEFAHDLHRFLENKPISAKRSTAVEHAWRWCQRNPAVAALAVCVVFVALLGLAGVLYQWQVALKNEKEAQQYANSAQQKTFEANKQRDDAKKANSKLTVAMDKLKDVTKEAQKQRDDAKEANAKLRETLKKLRRVTYNAHMNLAKHAWDAGGAPRVTELLRMNIPKNGEEDLRGFEWYYFRNIAKSVKYILRGHSNPVIGVAVSPDGRLAASICMGKQLRIWDLTTGASSKVFPPHKRDYVRCLDFSPDGKMLATGGDDKAIRLFDAETLEEIGSITDFTDPVTALAFSPDGKRIACVSNEFKKSGDLTVHEFDTGKIVFRLADYKGGAQCLSYSKDGKRIAANYGGHLVRVVDANSGNTIQSFPKMMQPIQSLDLSPDGKTVVFTSYDRSPRLWSVETGEPLQHLLGHWDLVVGVAFSPDGKQVATGADRVRLWDVRSGTQVAAFTGHQQYVPDLAFAPDGLSLVTGSGDHTLRVWDTRESSEPFMFRAHHFSIDKLCVSPDGKHLATSSSNRALSLWDIDEGKILGTFKHPKTDCDRIAFSPDGKLLAAVYFHQDIHLWSIPDFKKLATIECPDFTAFWIGFSADGEKIFTASRSWDIRVWDISKHAIENTYRLKETFAGFQEVAFSHHGKWIATCTAEDTVRLWNSSSGQLIVTMGGDQEGLNCLSFSKDDQLLAGGARDRSIVLWDATTGKKLQVLKGHTGPVTHVAFSPDGKRLASIGLDNVIKLWDVESGQETLTLVYHYTRPSCLAFSPDGTELLTGWIDGKVRVWRAPR